MRRVTFRQLRAFVAVARCHSFAQAAAGLRLSPSAVSLQIKELETWLDALQAENANLKRPWWKKLFGMTA